VSSPTRVRRTATLTAASGGDEAGRIDVFQPVRVPRATDEVCIAVLDALRGGLFTVGDRLPREKDLAERFEVSSNTVSQALAILEQAGIIRQRRGRYGGTSVVSLANVRSVLASILATSQSNSRAELRNLLELRRPLELQAAVLTAQRADEDQLGQLHRIAQALRPDLPTAEFRATDVQFHLYLGEACGNARLRDYLRSYFDEYQHVRDRFPVRHLELEAAVQSQHAYFEAIASRKRRKVIAAADAHLGAVEELFLGERLQFAS
jgi:GntR family transcriptional regulator, transcriptional repressor for pyruvate dehydrogenase complex